MVVLENVTASYNMRRGLLGSRSVKVVDGVSLSIPENEAVALVGESGSGKTTVGKLSIRLLKPLTGRIFYDGLDVTRLPENRLGKLRRETRMIFQDPYASLNPYMSVGEFVEEPLLIHGVEDKAERVEIVYKALEEVRLTPPQDFAQKYPHMLSGGQRQRVAIARAIVLKPRYLVADEPVSMIDASSRAEVLEVLKTLQKDYRMAILYIAHDLATTRYFADRVAVMYLGRIVEMGEVEEILSEPLHPYTQGLIASIPEPDPGNRFVERETIQGEPPSPQNIPSGCRFHPRCPKAFERCRVEDPPLREVRRGRWVACHLY
ncbi:peptide/nickel ABC transporter ATPase subunit [Candidatus Caldarchaeum subterraneum]|uniref:Peptide/nickel ABC transporter ATPase subunit n=1 Tax=Caldiarchaeum subterraneum TaxID=311458 RepID=E6N5G3_CALS0|nr:peptide/nickel ABC transporter ATPase subunit [Candidatus Caldarchaeum subterraneum]BAJ49333.1 peptide/nickel ABC transporter ATPase subunit [Candidatus Caldarchaeum subterraneum]BAJ50348.1 peptide/nickel ABC transporter ATPase subunit [Candidatus Caldarchaeum subterraneum]